MIMRIIKSKNNEMKPKMKIEIDLDGEVLSFLKDCAKKWNKPLKEVVEGSVISEYEKLERMRKYLLGHKLI